MPSDILNKLLRMSKRFSLVHRNGANRPVPVFIMIIDTYYLRTEVPVQYQYNSEIQYTNENSRYNYGNSGEKQCYFWHGNFPHSQRTQSPATGQNQCAPDVPRGQFWPRHIQNFVRQWRKNAASAKHCYKMNIIFVNSFIVRLMGEWPS